MKLEDILAFQNPWWRTGSVGDKEKLGYFERPMLNRVFSQLSDGGKVVSIIGPRRVGKTVIVHQAVQRLLKDGVAPNRIFYLPLDNPEITKSGIVNELMDFVAQAVKTPLYELETPVYVFLDEVHKLRSWGGGGKALARPKIENKIYRNRFFCCTHSDRSRGIPARQGEPQYAVLSFIQ